MKFFEGMKLKSIFWENGSIDVGRCGCSSIEVIMENGQCAYVAWAFVQFEDGRRSKYNLSMCEGVQLL